MLLGFENQALDELLEDYKEHEIFTDIKDIPEIWYTLNSTNKRYYPDIYIPKDNIIIEVKSTYTYEADIEKNLAKEKACKKAGFNFKFLIY